MFRYERAKILPFFLNQGLTVAELARRAGVSHTSAQRAVDGEKIAATIIAKVANALGIKPEDFMADPSLEKKERTSMRTCNTKFIKVISEPTAEMLETAIREDELVAEKNGFLLQDVQFSTASDGEIRYSALLVYDIAPKEKCLPVVKVQSNE